MANVVGPSAPGGISAAPRSFPITQPTAGVAPPAPAAQTLGSVAGQLANQSIAAQVAAYHQQQAADNLAAQHQAGQLNQAALAAANFLRPLGNITKQDYADALAQNTGLASGYSGQLQTDALGAAGAAQNSLAGIPGNTQTVVNHGAELGNLLYGLRGSLPGQALVTEGLGATAAARALPANVLATGQLDSQGAITAGRNQAAALTPQIAAAEGKLPALTQQYLSSLYGQQQKQVALNQGQQRLNQGQERVNTEAAAAKASAALAVSKQNADVTYKNTYLAHLQAGDTEKVAHDKATEAAGVAYHNSMVAIAQQRANTSSYQATTSRINATKPSSSGGFTLGGTRYNADGTVLVKGPAGSSSAGGGSGALTPDAAASRLRGFQTAAQANGTSSATGNRWQYTSTPTATGSHWIPNANYKPGQVVPYADTYRQGIIAGIPPATVRGVLSTIPAYADATFGKAGTAHIQQVTGQLLQQGHPLQQIISTAMASAPYVYPDKTPAQVRSIVRAAYTKIARGATAKLSAAVASIPG